jgi:hypothetical protein
MNIKRLLGWEEEKPEEEGDGPIVITIEFQGKIYTRRYPDLDTAQIRFPQYLSDLATLHRNAVE